PGFEFAPTRVLPRAHSAQNWWGHRRPPAPLHPAKGRVQTQTSPRRSASNHASRHALQIRRNNVRLKAACISGLIKASERIGRSRESLLIEPPAGEALAAACTYPSIHLRV